MPEESNLPKTLHELVSQTNDDGKNRKTVGYSVSSYAGVLSALEKAKAVVNNTSEGQQGLSYGGSSTTYTSRSWTFLSNYGNDNTTVIQNEFYQSDLNQVRVFLRDYMPFVLDCKKDDGTIERTCVGRRDYASCPLLHGGISVSSSQNPQFPPAEWSQNNLSRCKNGIASSDNGEGFVIGLGVAFNQVVINYFKHFYPNMQWTENNLKSLAAKGHLCGELMVPKGDNAKVLHSKITVDISQSNTSSYDVFVPVPLMLINDFKELGYVRVRNNTTEENIDGNKLRFPFSDKKFNHKKCEIEGFTPDAVKDYVPGSNTRHIEYRYTGLNGGQEIQGRMRFYFSPESQQEVANTIGVIPDEYKEKLFRGVIAEDGYYKTETVISESFGEIATTIQEVLEEFNAKLKTPIPVDGLYKALLVVAQFESGGTWTKWRDIGDSEGVSAGALQCTENSGGIAHVIETFIGIKKAEGGDCTEEENLLARARNKQLTNDDAALWKKMYDENPMRMQVAQMKAWTEGYHGQKAIETCNAFSPSSPLAFAAIAGATNHWPGIMLKNYRLNGMSASLSEKDKAIMAEAIHLKVSIQRQTGKIVSVLDIIANPLSFANSTYVGRWRGWCNRCKSIIDGANRGDLDIADYKAYHN